MLHNEQIINKICIIIKAGITIPAFIIIYKYLKIQLIRFQLLKMLLIKHSICGFCQVPKCERS
jgi:hypothetical protein